MRFTSLLIILFFVSACRKKQFENTALIAHAGSGLSIETAPYHDNSYEAIHYGIEMQGIAGVEVDVQVSADGTAWLFHDPELEVETNGFGCIGSSTDEYISSLRYSSLNNERLTRLKDIDFPFGARDIYLDIRSFDFCKNEFVDVNSIINAVQSGLLSADPVDINVIVTKKEWLEIFAAEGWTVYYEVTNVNEYFNLPESLLQSTAGVCIRNESTGKNDVQALHAISKKVIIFEARSPKAVRRMLKKNPDIVLIDDLKGALIEKY